MTTSHSPLRALKAQADKIAAMRLRAGLCHTCSRCGYETSKYDCGHAIGDEAVCEDCMTLAADGGE